MGKKVYPQKKGHVKKTMSHACENMSHLKKLVVVEKKCVTLAKLGKSSKNK